MGRSRWAARLSASDSRTMHHSCLAPLDGPLCADRGLGAGCADRVSGQPPQQWVLQAFAAAGTGRKAAVELALRQVYGARLCGVALRR